MARQQNGAVLCTSCRLLISRNEKICPHCKSRQSVAFALAPSLKSALGPAADPVVALMIACGLMYAVSIAADPGAAMRGSGLFSMGSPSTPALYLLGMTGGAAWACGHLWTLLTAGFLHGGLLHIGFNMMWLRSLGGITVGAVGGARFLVIYLLSSAGGFLVSNLMSPNPTVGASAAVFGLLGALGVFGWRRGGTMGRQLHAQIVRWAGFLLIFGLMMPGVDNWAHGGGLAAGAALGFLLPKHEGARSGRVWDLLAVVLVGATAVSVLLSIWRMWGPVQHNLPIC